MKHLTTTTFKYINLSFHDDGQEEKSCSASPAKKNTLEPYQIRMCSKGDPTMMEEERITGSPPKLIAVQKKKTEEPIIESPPRQRRTEEDTYQPFQQTFPDEFNPFRGDAKLSVVVNCEHREGAPATVSTPTKAEADLLFNVPLKLEHSPTTVVHGPGSRCYINVEASRSPDFKTDGPETEIFNIDSEESKTDTFATAVGESQIARLSIDKLDAFHYGRSLHRLRASTQVSMLIVSRATGTNRTRPARDLSQLFEMIETLPRLSSLHLIDFEAQDLAGVHEILYKHPTLMGLRLNLSRGAVDEIMLRTLSTIPNLTDVTIETEESFPFHILLRSTSLRTLCISSVGKDFTFADDHIMPLVEMVEQNSTLQSMYLEPVMSCGSFKFLASALRMNTGLDTLQVSVSGTGREADHVADAMVTALEKNRSLKTLWNLGFGRLHVSLASKDKLITALECSPTIRSFVFVNEDPSFRQRKEAALKRHKDSFMGRCFSGCGRVLQDIQDMDTDYVVHQVKSQIPRLSKGFEQVKMEGSRVGTNLRSSFGNLVSQTTSLCHNSSSVDDKVVSSQ